MDDHIEFRDTVDSDDYRIGSDGSLLSRLIKGSKFGRHGPWRRLSPIVHRGSRGCYLKATLRVRGVSLQRFIHHLVLEAFVGPCPEGLECCHGDGDGLNNRLDNLRWDTHASNIQDTMNLDRVPKGETHHSTSMKESDVIGIIEVSREVASATYREIATLFGTDRKTVSRILRGETWGWLTGIEPTVRPKGRPKGRRQKPLGDLGSPDAMTN